MNDFYTVIYDGLYVTTEYEGENLEEALEALGEVTGASVREDITARIFERFCVGK